MGGVNELVAQYAGTDYAVGVAGAYVTIYGIIALYVFLAVAILLAIIFPAIQMFKSLKTALTALAAAGIISLFFLACYWMSAGEAMTVIAGDKVEVVSEGTMKMVEAFMYMLYFMLGIAILSVAVAPLVSYLKK